MVYTDTKVLAFAIDVLGVEKNISFSPKQVPLLSNAILTKIFVIQN